MLPVRHRRRKSCPDCGRRLRFVTWEVPVLFWMHGHGYTVRETIAVCRCGYRRHVESQALNPLSHRVPHSDHE